MTSVPVLALIIIITGEKRLRRLDLMWREMRRKRERKKTDIRLWELEREKWWVRESVRLKKRIAISVTRLIDYFSTFGHLYQWKFAQMYRKFAKVGSKFCQIIKNPGKLPKTEDFAKVGKFSKSSYTEFAIWGREKDGSKCQCNYHAYLPTLVPYKQCDQMTKLCFQYLSIFSNENVPNSIQIVPKWVENFAQNQINLKYIAKDF